MRSLSGAFYGRVTLTSALPLLSLPGSCSCSFFLLTCSFSLVATSFGDLETSSPCHPGIPSLEDFFLPCKATSCAPHSCSCSSFSQETFSWQLLASTLAPLISPVHQSAPRPCASSR